MLFKNQKIPKFLFMFIISQMLLFGQTKDPDQILNNVKKNFDRINDYSVDINIKVDVSFLKMPPTNAKIYFKKPDKIKLSSKSFALLPKQGLDFSPVGILQNKYTAVFLKDTIIGKKNLSVIKIIPLSDASDVILTTLWVDQKPNEIMKAESATKVNGTFLMEFNYDKSPDDFPLPSSMIFSFNSSRFSVPQLPGDNSQENSTSNENKKEKKTEVGKVYVNYYNYKVNKGLPDSIFTRNVSSNK
jgi:hypothetical protein